jgi:hypothetical protein
MVAAWRERDRDRASASAPWELIEDIFIFGSTEEMKERLGRYVEEGVTLPVLTPVTTPDRFGELIEALAPA